MWCHIWRQRLLSRRRVAAAVMGHGNNKNQVIPVSEVREEPLRRNTSKGIPLKRAAV